MNKTLKEFEEGLTLPYALGNDFTLADILLYPWFSRWCALEKHLGIKIEETNAKIHTWIKNVQARDSVKVTKQPNEFYIDGYSGYFS